jgi:glycine cleavage system transcriptional repressor
MKYVVITAVGDDRTGIVNTLSDEILKDGGNIEDSRMAVLGGAFTIIMLVAGDPEAIDKLVIRIPAMEEKLGMTMVVKKTKPRQQEASLLPYRVDVVCMDHPGIVHDVADFFANRGINIEDMSTTTHAAAHTGTPVFSMHLTIAVDTDSSIAELRHDFQDFCDDLNLDSTMELAAFENP